MNANAIHLQRRLERAVQDLHQSADALVNALEGSPDLVADSAAGDNARAAYEGARRWRSLVESGE
jgi:hypothetical protein